MKNQSKIPNLAPKGQTGAVEVVHQGLESCAVRAHFPLQQVAADLVQGCKIRSGRDRIIRIIAIGIESEIIKILLAFCRNSSKIEKFDKFSTFSTEFGEIPRNFHQDRCKIR